MIRRNSILPEGRGGIPQNAGLRRPVRSLLWRFTKVGWFVSQNSLATLLEQRHKAHHLCIVTVLLKNKINCSSFPSIPILKDRVKMCKNFFSLKLLALIGEEQLYVALFPQRKILVVKSWQVSKSLQLLRPSQHSFYIFLGMNVVKSIEAPQVQSHAFLMIHSSFISPLGEPYPQSNKFESSLFVFQSQKSEIDIVVGQRVSL